MTRHIKRKKAWQRWKRGNEHEQATLTEHLLCARHRSGSEIFSPSKTRWGRYDPEVMATFPPSPFSTPLSCCTRRGTHPITVHCPGVSASLERYNSRLWLSSPKSKQSSGKKSLKGYQTLKKLVLELPSFCPPVLPFFLPSARLLFSTYLS